MSELEQLQEQVAKLETERDELKGTIEDLNSDLRSDAGTIEELRTRVADLVSTMNDIDNMADKASRTVQNLLGEIESTAERAAR